MGDKKVTQAKLQTLFERVSSWADDNNVRLGSRGLGRTAAAVSMLLCTAGADRVGGEAVFAEALLDDVFRGVQPPDASLEDLPDDDALFEVPTSPPATHLLTRPVWTP